MSVNKSPDLQSTIFSIEKPQGQSVSLRLGEVIKAEVFDILDSGGVCFKIKGQFITADVEIPLQKDSAVLLKVLGSWDAEAGKQLRLQFLGYADDSSPAASNGNSQVETTRGLLRTLSDLTSSPEVSVADLTGVSEELLKALPADNISPPRDIRIQLQDVLRESLRATVEQSGSTQVRASKLISFLENCVKTNIRELSDIIPANVMVNVEDLPHVSLKDALENTGVAFEAKLKSLTLEELARQETVDRKSIQDPIFEGSPMVAVKEDLKGMLSLLKVMLTQKGAVDKMGVPTVASDAIRHETIASAEFPDSKDLLKNVESLLKDIQTFQLLSKATDSYYSFLPIVWNELKEGQVAFKRGRRSEKGSSYYCMLNLDFSSFGKLTIMILMQNSEFFTSFKAENSKLRASIETHTRELQDVFGSHGLRLKAVNVLDIEDTSLAPFERLETFESIINIKV